jgi:hypothetical protein
MPSSNSSAAWSMHSRRIDPISLSAISHWKRRGSFGGLRPELPNSSEIRYHSRQFRSHLEKSWFTGRGVP